MLLGMYIGGGIAIALTLLATALYLGLKEEYGFEYVLPYFNTKRFNGKLLAIGIFLLYPIILPFVVAHMVVILLEYEGRPMRNFFRKSEPE